ncbi:Biopolymer transport protein-like protein [Desulfamplus magnetovallimortis]|uniref:Biopolymer transport protein-like protein n=1 Tax=Desulfamplus magnetovallimortis TaxID=1246637 RepID=A0A1W1HHR1_9BACT|nr:MotA/TolQ/ExbB proton channel family protein [Desulfamplus magnetovallimortis]SLM31912.1 Biopolymer transport protein-like protein [Desulfamplus magnetovallimortis]
MTDIGALLKTFIYLISSSLLYPVLFLLVVLILFIIACSGTFFAEWLERFRLKKSQCPPQRLPAVLKNENPEGMVSHRVVRYVNALRVLMSQKYVTNTNARNSIDSTKSINSIQSLNSTPGNESPMGARGKGAFDMEVAVENMLQATTLELWKSIDRLRILVRVAPSLGLIGTLIPMGTGLAALGQGDMTRLTSDLVIAFTTTVTGLAIGTSAFFFYTLRRRWIEEDIKNMELATELLLSPMETDNRSGQ